MGDAGKPPAQTAGGRQGAARSTDGSAGLRPTRPRRDCRARGSPQRETPGCDAPDISDSLRFTERFWGLGVAVFWSFVLGFGVLVFSLFLPVLAGWPEIALMLTRISYL